jgi:glycerol-1-phosphate dehydrogenase [NAD(P)+]
MNLDNIIKEGNDWKYLGGKPAVIIDDYFKDKYGSYILDIPKAYYINSSDSRNNRINYKLYDIDYIIGLGGGVNLDQAKLFAKENNLSWISVPTKPTAAIFSNVSSKSILNKRVTIKSPLPLNVYLDSNFSDIPSKIIKSEYGDFISGLTATTDLRLEACIKNYKLNNRLIEESYNLSRNVLSYTNLNSKKTLRLLYDSSIKCGILMNKYGSTRCSSGSEHALSHSFDTIKDYKKQLHGLQVGLSTYISFILQYNKGLINNDLNPEIFKEKLKANNFPIKISDIGMNIDVFKKSLSISRNIRNYECYNILNEYKDKEIISLLEEKGVIDVIN